MTRTPPEDCERDARQAATRRFDGEARRLLIGLAYRDLPSTQDEALGPLDLSDELRLAVPEGGVAGALELLLDGLLAHELKALGLEPTLLVLRMVASLELGHVGPYRDGLWPDPAREGRCALWDDVLEGMHRRGDDPATRCEAPIRTLLARVESHPWTPELELMNGRLGPERQRKEVAALMAAKDGSERRRGGVMRIRRTVAGAPDLYVVIEIDTDGFDFQVEARLAPSGRTHDEPIHVRIHTLALTIPAGSSAAAGQLPELPDRFRVHAGSGPSAPQEP